MTTRRSSTMHLAPGEKPYVVLTTVNSETSLNTHYEIRTSKRDGQTYCTCPGFFMHGKRCKHMDAYRAAVASGRFQVQHATRTVDTTPHPTISARGPLRRRAPMSAGRASAPTPAPALTPSAILLRELAAIDVAISETQASRIAAAIQMHVLAGRPAAPAPAPEPEAIRIDDMRISTIRLNDENVRCITLPD